MAEQTLNEGQNLLDLLSLPLKNAFGHSLNPDHKAHIEHVQKLLEEIQERKVRCDELADVRKLKLQQLLQLRTCERDADQVGVVWWPSVGTDVPEIHCYNNETVLFCDTVHQIARGESAAAGLTAGQPCSRCLPEGGVVDHIT